MNTQEPTKELPCAVCEVVQLRRKSVSSFICQSCEEKEAATLAAIPAHLRNPGEETILQNICRRLHLNPATGKRDLGELLRNYLSEPTPLRPPGAGVPRPSPNELKRRLHFVMQHQDKFNEMLSHWSFEVLDEAVKLWGDK